MTEVVDVDQMESAPLPVPSTSRTPVPRLLASTASSSLSTPPAPHLQHQRITRSQTVATASASGSLPRVDVPTARQPLHHGAKVSPKREPSTSDLSTPPDVSTSRRSSPSPTARGVTPNLRGSWDNTGEQGVAAQRSSSLVPNLLASGDSHAGTIQPGASRSTRPNESMFENPEHKLDYPPALVEPLSQPTTASMPLDNIDLISKRPCRPSLPPSDLPRKRKKQVSDSDDDGQPLLSEYMCPICFSPPKSAVITPCGHILCGACLHGATTARAPNTQPLCPVCRTPIPNLRFAVPEHHSYPGILHPQRPQSQGAGGRRRRRRHAPPPSRTLGNGVSLPTRGEEMIDLDRLEAESQVIDVSDGESEEGLEDPGRSGVIGLELLTMGSL